MMVFKKFFCLMMLFTLVACVDGLNSDQKRKLVGIRNQMPENYEEEKNVGAAAAFGLLPGGGSFYTRNYVVGAVDLLLWPLSILWDPINGINGAQEINYYSSLQSLKRAQKKELGALEEKLDKNTISQQQFLRQQSIINKKYDLDNLL